jgi:superfamily II DNA/RNA helicase
MGFLPQVRHLLDMTNPVRQTAFFSATLDQEVASLTQRYQTDPVTHHVGGDDKHLEAAHYFWQVDPSDRIEITADIISSSTPTLVFTRTRHGADKVARLLERRGIRAAAIHGGRSQSQRTRALKAFGQKNVDALIATDVAARGSTSTASPVSFISISPPITRTICTDPGERPGPGRAGWWSRW